MISLTLQMDFIENVANYENFKFHPESKLTHLSPLLLSEMVH